MSTEKKYLDNETALKRVGGNVMIYKKLLNLYTAENHVAELCEAIINEDKEKTIHLAHTVKGVCANLSLDKLMEIASDIEEKVKNDIDVKSHIPELESTNEKTLELVNEYINTQ
jgi:HPt (histidine-containing phosphotransfer) domain-containing protein